MSITRYPLLLRPMHGRLAAWSYRLFNGNVMFGEEAELISKFVTEAERLANLSELPESPEMASTVRIVIPHVRVVAEYAVVATPRTINAVPNGYSAYMPDLGDFAVEHGMTPESAAGMLGVVASATFEDLVEAGKTVPTPVHRIGVIVVDNKTACFKMLSRDPSIRNASEREVESCFPDDYSDDSEPGVLPSSE